MLTEEQKATMFDLTVKKVEFWLAFRDYVNEVKTYIDYPYGSLQRLVTEYRDFLAELVDQDEEDTTISSFRTDLIRFVRFLARQEWFEIPIKIQVDSSDQRSRVIREWMIRWGDTPQSVAQTLIGDADAWHEIAIANDLEYPYFTDDRNYVRELYATGNVTFTIPGTLSGSYVIPNGTILVATTEEHTDLRFKTTAQGTITSGNTSVIVPAECLTSGPAGNVPPNTIKTVESTIPRELFTLAVSILGTDTAGNDDTEAKSPKILTQAAVNNNAAFSGGRIKRVALLGETVRVPVPIERAEMAMIGPDQIYGTDLSVSGGILGIGNAGDLALATGVNNIAEAVEKRLLTEKGDMIHHSLYGTELHRLGGGIATDTALDLIVTDIEEAILGDPRIERIEKMEADFDQQTLVVKFLARVKNTDNLLPMRVEVPA